MQRRQPGIVSLLLCGWLLVGMLVPAVGWGQAADPLQQVEKRLIDKRAAAEAHRKLMEGIKDPEQLNTAMQQHFQMTEEILALMMERRKLVSAQAPSGGAPAGQSSGMQSGGMGMKEHGMGMMQKEMGGMQSGGAQSGGMQGMGMMQKEMSGMQSGGMQGSGTQSGGTMQQGTGNPAGSGIPGHSTSGAQGGQATPGNDMEQMMQRITEHSAYMETVKDQTLLTQEMLRHQKMLDQMLQLMQ